MGSRSAGVPDGLRPPRQDRSRRSLERVLDAGAEILAADGWEGFTIADVARRANASSGLIYKRFESKAALFEAILLRENERITHDESGRLERVEADSHTLAEYLSAAVPEMAIVARREAPLLRVFNERSLLEPRWLEHAKRGRAATRLFKRGVLRFTGEIAHPDPERAADMAFWLVNATIDRRVNTPMWRHWRADAEDDWPEFVSDLVRAVLAFLLVPAAELDERAPGPPVAPDRH